MMTEPAAALPPTRLIRLPEVMHKVSLGRTAIYAMIKAGKFPSPVKQGAASAWREDAIDAYVAALTAASPASRPMLEPA